jgi:tripartite-type tricarboxylate transporter receptor subunit TctC
MLPKIATTLAAILIAGPGLAQEAEDFPTRPITLIAPFSAGGSSDSLARALARELEEGLGQSVIVLNQPGAGGTIGLTQATASDPDGYTIALGGIGSLIHSAGVYKDMIQFDVRTDLAPISLVAATPVVLVAGPASDIQDLDQLIAEAKAAPGDLPFGTSGVGSAMHLTAEVFQRAAGLTLLHVSYPGVAPAMVDLLGGQIPLGFFDATSVLPHTDGTEVRPLAVAAPERIAQLPDVPTFTERGFPLDGDIWYGLVAPADTPEAIVLELAKAVGAAVKTDRFKASADTLGFRTLPAGSEEMARRIASDLDLWLPVIEEAGVSTQ